MSELTARQRQAAEVWARDPHRCALRPAATGWPGEGSKAGPCEGRLQVDHILKVSALLRHQSQLQRRAITAPGSLTTAQARFAATDPEELIADARNGWLLCMNGHHAKKDRRLLVVVEEILLPEHFVDFVADYELAHLAESELRPRPVPGSQDGSPRAAHGGRILPGD